MLDVWSITILFGAAMVYLHCWKYHVLRIETARNEKELPRAFFSTVELLRLLFVQLHSK